MEVEIFTLADHAADYGNGKLVIAGTFDNIFVANFPAVHPMCSVAVRIRLANSEAGRHKFEIRALDSKGRKFQDPFGGEFEVQPNPNADHSTLNIVWSLANTKFDSPGKFAFEFHFDNEFRTGLTLTVVKYVPPQNSSTEVQQN